LQLPDRPPASGPTADKDKRVYDAFISYSRREAAFCEILERNIGSYRPPAGLGLPTRRLSVFRDANDLVGADYFTAIDGYLRNSSKLIVVCSPSARASRYVEDEIRRFVEARGAEHVVPIILAGLPNNEAAVERETEKAFPDTLCTLLQMPLAIDFRGFDVKKHKVDRGAYSGAWHSLLASLLDRSREEIEERERKRSARQLRLTVAVSTAIGLSLLGLAIWALFERNDALRQRDRALVGQLAAEANLYLTDEKADGRLSVLLAGHALQYGNSVQAYKAIATALHRLPPELVATLPAVLANKGLVEKMVASPDAVHVAAISRYGPHAEIWNLRTGRMLTALEQGDDDGPIEDVRFNRDAKHFMVLHAANTEIRHYSTDEHGKGTVEIGQRADWTRMIEVFDLSTGQALSRQRLREFAIAESGSRWLLAAVDDGARSLTVKDLVSGETVFSVPVEQPVQQIALSADAAYVAAAGAGQAWVFDVARKQMTGTLKLDARLTQLSIANDGDRLLTVDEAGVAKLWSMKQGDAMVLESGKASAASFSPLGHYATVRAADGVKVVETTRGHVVLSEGQPGNAATQLMALQGVSNRNPVVGLQLTKSETAWVVGRGQGQIELWQPGLLGSFGTFGVVEGMANVVTLNHGSPMNQFSASEDGTMVATVGRTSGMSPTGTMVVEPNKVRVWDLQSWMEIARIASWDPILAVLTPDGSHLLTAEHAGDIARASEPSRIKVWKLPAATGTEATVAGEWPESTSELAQASVSIDGRTIAYKNPEGSVDVRAAGGVVRPVRSSPPASGKATPATKEASEQGTPDDEGHETAPSRPPRCAWVPVSYTYALSEDGRFLAEADRRTVRVRAVDGSRDATTIDFAADVCAVALSGDGRFVAATLAENDTVQRPATSPLPRIASGTWVTHVREVAGRRDVAFSAHDLLSVVIAVSPSGRFVLTQRLATPEELAKDPNPLRRVAGTIVEPIVDGWDSARPNRPVFTFSVAGTPFGGLPMPALASFSKDGRFFVIGSGGLGTVHVVSDGTGVAEVDLSLAALGLNTAPGHGIMRIGFNTDETQLRTAEVDLTAKKTLVRSFQWQPRMLIDSACGRLQPDERELTPVERRSLFGERKVDLVCGK
jgi:WD40 repeat protein